MIVIGTYGHSGLPGITLGSHLSARLPERVLRPVLAVVLVIVGSRMLRG